MANEIESLLATESQFLSDSEQIQWFLAITRWLHSNRDISVGDELKAKALSSRIKTLLVILEGHPAWKLNFSKTVTSVLKNISSIRLFIGVGMSGQSGFLQDFLDRVQEKLLPQSPLSEDLSTLLLEVFPDEEDSQQIKRVETEILRDFLKLFSQEADLHQRLLHDLVASSYVLSSQVLGSAIAIKKELFENIEAPSDWPESRLHKIIADLQENPVTGKLQELESLLDQIEAERVGCYQIIQKRGIKVELVYWLETQRRRIERLRSLLRICFEESDQVVHIRIFIAQLILDIHHQRSLRSFFSENLNLLTRRIVQRNSDIGEHYVTFTLDEFRRMFKSASGGGVVTAGTVFMKMLLGTLPFTGFLKGLADSLNYAGSFLFIQIMGFTLATKQPSATAPYLAESLKKSVLESRKAVIALLRTQFIAVLGNLSMVFPICFALSWLSMQSGHPFVSTQNAVKILYSSDIFGASPIFAAFTGCLLFLASLIAGWIDNWVTLTRLPDRIQHNPRFIGRFGQARATKAAKFIRRNSNALAANISLGLLLGLAPQFLKFFGFPAEVRHITLATGAFASSLPAILQTSVSAWEIIDSVAGLLAIGILNISVSFTLALLLASISSQIKLSALWDLIKWGLRIILTKPWLLFMPEKVPSGESMTKGNR